MIKELSPRAGIPTNRSDQAIEVYRGTILTYGHEMRGELNHLPMDRRLDIRANSLSQLTGVSRDFPQLRLPTGKSVLLNQLYNDELFMAGHLGISFMRNR